MDSLNPQDRLSRIETLWTLLGPALQGAPERVNDAQERLLRRYSAAAYRYLLAALRDAHAAEEVLQEFWLRFVRGHFRNARPERGRFRALIKTALVHLVIDYRRRQRALLRLGTPAEDVEALAVAAAGPDEGERQFLEGWRQELLERTWQALAEVQGETRQPLYEVLRFRAEQPDLSSEGMAARLGARLGKPLTAAGVRQVLKRAREKFAELLVQEVALTLADPSAEELEEEVTELGLLSYCRSALGRRAGPAE
jgi:RNA polymerase sigma factor (sigma-70 family)